MDKEIDVLIEQLREKDCQIERLQHIIENLTKKEDEEDEDLQDLSSELAEFDACNL